MQGENEETIAALSTPAGESGIAVIRVSGPTAFSLVAGVYAPHGGKKVTFEHHRIYHGHLEDGREVIDEVMCAPKRKRQENWDLH